MKAVQAKKLFNPLGDDSLQARQLIGGNTTNIFNLNNVKYTWANKLYRTMMANFWVPEKVDLTTDKLSDLTESEATTYKGILAFLIFLDSLQTNNLPNISSMITAPEVNLLLAVQTYQEAVHSQSYQYIIESNIPSSYRNGIYDYWRDDDVLFERIKYIASIYQAYLDNPTDANAKKVIIANYVLEGIYFYNGFQFFYNLASRNKMVGTSSIIKLINRDELTHCVIFQDIINEIMTEEDNEMIYDTFRTAVEQEIRWSNHIIGDNILGINSTSTEQYTKYLANRRLKYIKRAPLYEEVKNPYKHLEKIADVVGDGSVKANFFETTVTGYNQSSALEGWNDF